MHDIRSTEKSIRCKFKGPWLDATAPYDTEKSVLLCQFFRKSYILISLPSVQDCKDKSACQYKYGDSEQNQCSGLVVVGSVVA